MARYSQEVHDFIRDNVKGKTIADLTALVNKKFKLNFTYEKMKSYMNNHKLKNGLKGGVAKGCSLIFSKDIEKFIANNYKGLYNKELTELVNKKFKTKYTVTQIESYKSNRHFDSGLTGYFLPGHIPVNKNKKMSAEQYEKCKSTMFKKGNVPQNCAPVGTEVITKDGYIKVKIGNPNKWKLKHRLVYEKHFGNIPNTHIIFFIDQNKQNCSIENLMCIPKKEFFILNRKRMITANPELNKTAIIYSKLSFKINKKKKELKHEQ